MVVFHAPRGFASRRDAPETAARHRHLPRAFRGACTQGGSEFPVPFRCRGGDAAGRPGGPRAAAKKLQRPLPRPRKYPPAAPAGCPSGTRTSRRSCTRARAHTEVGRTQCETCVRLVGVDIVQWEGLEAWMLAVARCLSPFRIRNRFQMPSRSTSSSIAGCSRRILLARSCHVAQE